MSPLSVRDFVSFCACPFPVGNGPSRESAFGRRLRESVSTDQPRRINADRPLLRMWLAPSGRQQSTRRVIFTPHAAATRPSRHQSRHPHSSQTVADATPPRREGEEPASRRPITPPFWKGLPPPRGPVDTAGKLYPPRRRDPPDEGAGTASA